MTLYSDPQRTGATGAVPLHPAADTSARLSLAVAAGGDASVAAGSAAGSVTIWDAATQQVREHYAGQHSGGVAALGFLPLRPSMLYSAGADGRVCLQVRERRPTAGMSSRHGWLAVVEALHKFSLAAPPGCFPLLSLLLTTWCCRTARPALATCPPSPWASPPRL